MSDQQANAYRQGATQSLATQRALEAAGQPEAAEVAQESVNANLDALAQLNDEH
ncbi:MAG: hypothetical protein HOW97_07985 [Catenulispora sp.]|nr:hypothetical protein [Catenulispora sp.]